MYRFFSETRKGILNNVAQVNGVIRIQLNEFRD